MENRKENHRTDLGSETVNKIVSLSPLSSALYLPLFCTRCAGKCWQNKSCKDDTAFLSNENSYKRNASSTCTIASISSVSGVTSTNIRSFGVCTRSIYVTRAISVTLVNIWKIINIKKKNVIGKSLPSISFEET